MHVCAQIRSQCIQAPKVSILGSQENYSDMFLQLHKIAFIKLEREGENLGVMD